MKIPLPHQIGLKRSTVSRFGGLNMTDNVSAGEFGDMLNLTSDSYPLMSVRPQRAYWTSTSFEPQGGTVNGLRLFINNDITAAQNINGHICYCTKNSVVAGGTPLDGVTLDSSVTVRTMVPFGNGFFVVPDGVYVTFSENETQVKRAAFNNEASRSLSVSVCLQNGTEVSCDYIGSTRPTTPAENFICADTSGEPHGYKYVSGAWQSIGKLYLKLSGTGIGLNCFNGLLVSVSGVYSADDNTQYKVIAAEDDYCVLKAPLVSPFTGTKLCGTKKLMPKLDFAVEHNNRIWGCRFGLNADGEFVNEIYASALGNPLEWNSFNGLSTDSYTASLGCAGAFTGACKLMSGVVFFKEDSIIRVSGYSPNDFTVSPCFARGVESGAYKSVVNINEIILYKNATGIMAYDGNFPYCISEKLGSKTYSSGAAGALGDKYYIAMTDENGQNSIFVYSLNTGVWHKEDDSQHVKFFVYMNNSLYMLCRVMSTGAGGLTYNSYMFMISDKRLQNDADCIFPGTPDSEAEYNYIEQGSFSWYAESGRLGSLEGRSVLRSLVFRLSLDKDAVFSVDIQCDGSNEWKKLYICCMQEKEAFSVPVNTPRCSTYRLRISGKGSCTVYSVGTVTESVSEVNGLGR